MFIERVRIERFRCFHDQEVTFNRYTCFVGPNGAGKSTILSALNLFFRETENIQTNLISLEEEDFHQKNTSEPIRITVTFGALGAEAETDFKDYVRQGKLIVTAEAAFDPATRKAEVRQYGQRLGMEAFRPFFEALPNTPAAELKTMFQALRATYPDLEKATTKDGMAAALQAYEAHRPGDCIPIASEDQFYGFSKGVNRLGKHVQWVYVPAVKDATTEQLEGRNTALGKLLARTVRQRVSFGDEVQAIRAAAQEQYQDVLTAHQGVLTELSESLTRRVSEWAHPDASVQLEWHQDPEKAVRIEDPLARMMAGEGEFVGNLARFGHGLQRSYLLALLHELASGEDISGPALILGCEEPELYQHPPQAKHLAHILRTLSTEDNAQIMVSTHSPLFVSGETFEDVRMVSKRDKRSASVSAVTFDEIAQDEANATGKAPLRRSGMYAKLHQQLQPGLNDMFFASQLVFVEGVEDVAYLTAGLHHCKLWDEFRRRGGQIIPTNCKSELLRPILVAKHMNIPYFVIFDADTNARADFWQKHEDDNRALLTTVGASPVDPKPQKVLWGQNYAVWPTQLSETVAEEIGRDVWTSKQLEADRHYGYAGNLRKNSLHIAFTLLQCFGEGKTSPSLEKLCAAVTNF
jgi:predicted ATP-dependent endonuclease of OLD family